MGTQQILNSHVMLPYTEEYQENLKYKHTLHGFNSIINLGGVARVTAPLSVRNNSEQELVCCC